MSDAGYVLDASALLALMLDEPGADRIHAVLPNATIGAVNLSEVIAKLQQRGVPDTVIDESIADLDIEVVPFDCRHAEIAGKLRRTTRSLGLALGDRACLALASVSGCTAITTDAQWKALKSDIEVELAR